MEMCVEAIRRGTHRIPHDPPITGYLRFRGSSVHNVTLRQIPIVPLWRSKPPLRARICSRYGAFHRLEPTLEVRHSLVVVDKQNFGL